ncbi:MAG: PDZ domain-containing protein [Verrucomicrobiales bacterium]
MNVVGIPILAVFGPAFLFLSSGMGQDTGPSPVSIVWSPEAETSGVCVNRRNWYVTVIPRVVDSEGAAGPSLQAAGQRVSAKILHVDERQRLCLLEASEEIAEQMPVALASGPAARAGELLESLAPDSDCRATVAGKEWSYRGEQLGIPLLRIRFADAGHLCAPGAPLVNQTGELECLLTDRELASETEAHAIPASQIRKLVLDMQRHQRTGRVWVGLVFHNHSSTPEVLEVKPNSPAEDGGFKPGDVILSLNRIEIDDLADVVEAVHNLPAGEATTFTVLRGLSRKPLEVVPEFAEANGKAARIP